MPTSQQSRILFTPSRPMARNNRVACIGDSITVAGGLTGQYKINNSGVGSYFGWASILPKTGQSVGDGRFRPDIISATGGFSIAQIKATHLPVILAANPRPGLCFVLGGTNDLASLTTQPLIDAQVANLQSIWSALLQAGIMPVACTVPASTANGTPAKNLSTSIAAAANAMAIPLADFQAVTADSNGNWLPGLDSGDGTHPNVAAGKLMGQVARNAADPYLPALYPPLVTLGTDKDGVLSWRNGCMQRDTNANGMPNGGQSETSDPWSVSTGGADVTFSLVSEAGVADGNWWRWNKSAFTATTQYTSSGGAGISPLIEDNHQVGLGFKCKVPTIGSTATVITVVGYKLSNASVKHASLTISGTTDPIAPFAFYYEALLPVAFARMRLDISIAGGTADLYIGQLTVRDLG